MQHEKRLAEKGRFSTHTTTCTLSVRTLWTTLSLACWRTHSPTPALTHPHSPLFDSPTHSRTCLLSC